MKELTESEKIQNWLSSKHGHFWITREFRRIQWGNAGLFQIKEDIEEAPCGDWTNTSVAYSCSFDWKIDARGTGICVDEELVKGLSCPA